MRRGTLVMAQEAVQVIRLHASLLSLFPSFPLSVAGLSTGSACEVLLLALVSPRSPSPPNTLPRFREHLHPRLPDHASPLGFALRLCLPGAAAADAMERESQLLVLQPTGQPTPVVQQRQPTAKGSLHHCQEGLLGHYESNRACRCGRRAACMASMAVKKQRPNRRVKLPHGAFWDLHVGRI